jgi:exosortase
MRLDASLRLWTILALWALVTAVYWPSPAVYLEQWADFVNITFTHGWLIVAVCLALVVRARHEIAAAPLGRSPAAYGALAACIIAWLICYRGANQDLHVTVFPAILWLAVVAAFGWRMGVVLAFPVAYFYLAVPSWAQLGDPLQKLTVFVVHGALALTGPPTRIAGNTIHIPNGSFAIEEGCSGLHFLIVGLAVAALHGELRRDSWRVRLVQLGVMTGLALLANWVRVYTIIEAGYLTDMQSYLVRVSHYWFGWGVFGVALVLLFWITSLFAPAAAPEPNVELASANATRAEAREVLTGALTTALVLVALPTLSWGLRAMQPAPILFADFAPPASWSPAAAEALSPWRPVFPGAAERQQFAYVSATGETVEIFRVAYRSMRQGAKLFGSAVSVAGRRLRLQSGTVIETAAGRFREEEVADRSGAHSLIWSRYEIAGRDFVVPLAAQLWYGLKATLSNPPASLIAYRAECGIDGTCAEARRALSELIRRAPAGEGPPRAGQVTDDTSPLDCLPRLSVTAFTPRQPRRRLS